MSAARIARRRGGAGAARRGGWRGTGGGAQLLDLTSGGAFTRSTEGSYLTAAPTDGTAAFLAWAAVNARRIENRGDGLGDMLLMEGSRTNLVTDSRACTGTGWTAAGIGTPTVTLNAGNGPDATTLADRVQAASAGAGPYQTIVSAGTNLRSQSLWAKRMPSAGAGTAQMSIAPGQDDQTAIVDSAWRRCDNMYSGGANPTHVPWEGRGIYGGAAQALDFLADLHQVEVGAFPSSPIRTTTAAVTRGADVLSYAVGQYPASFLDRGFRFTFAPDCTSAEQISTGSDFRFWSSISGTNLVQFAAGTAALKLYCGGVAIATSGALTWSRGQLLTITVEPLAGRLTVSGASSGNGTFTGTGAAWPSAAFTWSASATAFGRLGLTVVGL